MRDLRFRAFSDGAMHYGGFLIHATNGKLMADMVYIKEGDPVMQLTGLKDRNGKDIYVGDILLLDLISGDRYSKVHDCPLLEVPTVCFFEDEGWAPLFQYVGKPDTCLQVVGNIHQNPELLEPQKDIGV